MHANTADIQTFRHSDIQIFSQHETLRLQREVFALKQRLSRYELPEELRLELRLESFEHSAGEHDAFDAFDDRYRHMARRLDQHIKDHLPRYVDRNAHERYERYIDHMDVDIFASTELELGRFSDGMTASAGNLWRIAGINPV